MSRSATMRYLAVSISVIYFCAFSSPALQAQDVQLDSSVELSKENYSEWREHLLPSDSELKFLSIPWQRTMMAGIAKANEDDRPVLLWAMNGHPLGCT